MNMFKPTKAESPAEYIAMIDEPRRSQIKELDRLIRKILATNKVRLYNSVLGYGVQKFKYSSGKEVEWFKAGLASQKNYISVYVHAIEDGQYLPEKYKNLFPKASIGKSCIRFKQLEDIDINALKNLLKKI